MTFPIRKSTPDRLLVFARAPELGQVKTRLADELGAERALTLYQAMLEDLLEGIGHSTDTASVEVVWTGSPDLDGCSVRKTFHGCDLSTQARGNLGERLMLAFHEQIVFYRAEKVLAIGTDDPTMTRELIDNAFALLDSCDWVIGPAADGGYYLIGCRGGSFDIAVFEGISWSSSEVLPETLRKLKKLGETVALLPERSDLDRVEDVRQFSRRTGSTAPRTQRVLREWGWMA